MKMKQIPKSRRQPFAMRQMVTVPTAQGSIAGIGEKIFQRRRFDVAIAEGHIGFALMPRIRAC
jgi:hypothetical protein